EEAGTIYRTRVCIALIDSGLQLVRWECRAATFTSRRLSILRIQLWSPTQPLRNSVGSSSWTLIRAPEDPRPCLDMPCVHHPAGDEGRSTSHTCKGAQSGCRAPFAKTALPCGVRESVLFP